MQNLINVLKRCHLSVGAEDYKFENGKKKKSGFVALERSELSRPLQLSEASGSRLHELLLAQLTRMSK